MNSNMSLGKGRLSPGHVDRLDDAEEVRAISQYLWFRETLAQECFSLEKCLEVLGTTPLEDEFKFVGEQTQELQHVEPVKHPAKMLTLPCLTVCHPNRQKHSVTVFQESLTRDVKLLQETLHVYTHSFTICLEYLQVFRRILTYLHNSQTLKTLSTRDCLVFTDIGRHLQSICDSCLDELLLLYRRDTDNDYRSVASPTMSTSSTRSLSRTSTVVSTNTSASDKDRESAGHLSLWSVKRKWGRVIHPSSADAIVAVIQAFEKCREEMV